MTGQREAETVRLSPRKSEEVSAAEDFNLTGFIVQFQRFTAAADLMLTQIRRVRSAGCSVANRRPPTGTGNTEKACEIFHKFLLQTGQGEESLRCSGGNSRVVGQSVSGPAIFWQALWILNTR